MFDDLIVKKKKENLKVDSSWIKSFSYENGILVMKTISRKEYSYIDVPLYIWENLKEEVELGCSIGGFYNEYIKGQYEISE